MKKTEHKHHPTFSARVIIKNPKVCIYDKILLPQFNH